MTATFGRATRTAATIAAAALLAGTMTPAFAASPDGDKAPVAKTQEKAEVSKSRMICVKQFTTGSRIGHQTCKTRERWIKEDGVDPLDLQAR
ncbi:hypothetical protein [Sphingomonas sp.]|uniref:hypothetical protein n=1 Tax=Sphingomonas sp. TaxID=28214 RepID=UPI001B16E429|nr:hypothetical protein [Sphingomonas sp.]MBO9714301.1 hypothetical protein [Sphingomonas sp.]